MACSPSDEPPAGAVDAGGAPLADVTVDAPEPDEGAPPGPPNQVVLPVPPPPPADVGLLLTFDEIPGEMNGSVPYLASAPEDTAFVLNVNRANFTLDVLLEAELLTGSLWSGLEVVCDAALPSATGEVLEAGVAFGADAMGEGPRGLGHRRLRIDADTAVDEDDIHCAATLRHLGGQAQDEVRFHARTLPAWLDPFPTVEVWLVVLSRDIFEVESEVLEDGSIDMWSEYLPEGNGEPDFDEPFRVAGLRADAAPEAWAWLKARLLDEIRGQVIRVYQLDEEGQPTAEGVPIRLYFEGDEGAPDPADYSSAGGFSMIALGGDGVPADQEGPGFVFGKAKVDWNNQNPNDDSVYGLGVFVTSALRAVLTNPSGAMLLDEFLPGVGTPWGLHPADAEIMAEGFDKSAPGVSPKAKERVALIELALDLGGRGIGAILAHEMGHSLGLVPKGPPPLGLFAEVETDFVVEVAPDAHIDTPGLNVMQTGGSTDLVAAAFSDPFFNALNLAYLRRRLVVGP